MLEITISMKNCTEESGQCSKARKRNDIGKEETRLLQCKDMIIQIENLKQWLKLFHKFVPGPNPKQTINILSFIIKHLELSTWGILFTH